MTRGKRRPRLLDYAKATVASEVEAASRAAFAELRGDGGKAAPAASAIKQALAALCVLKVLALYLGLYI